MVGRTTAPILRLIFGRLADGVSAGLCNRSATRVAAPGSGYPPIMRECAMGRVWIVAAGMSLLIAGSVPGLAACSNETANAMAQQFSALVKLKMKTKPDEMGDLASEFGDVMANAADGVSDRTCADLDRLVKKARAL